jgi:hypothetical protein
MMRMCMSELNMAWKSGLLALALALPLAAQEADKKKAEEDAKAKIAEFKKALKGAKTEADVARTIEEHLGELQHPRIIAELKLFLGRSADLAAAAGQQLAKYKNNKEAAETLVTAAAARKDKEGIIKCLRYAGDTGCKAVAPKLVGYFKHREVDVAREAIDSSAKLRSAVSIDPLIALWRELDGIRDERKDSGGLGDLGGGINVGSNVQDEQIRRKNDLTSAVEDAFSKITGEPLKNSKEAAEWWRRAKGTFKEPE